MSFSEKTFGNRYLHGVDMYDYTGTLVTFAPTNPKILRPAFQLHLTDVNNANDTVASCLFALKTARDARFAGYYSVDGLLDLSRKVRDYLASQPDGKKTAAFKSVQKLVQKMVNYRKPKNPKDISTPPLPGDPPVSKERSTSEQSFGSLIRVGEDIHQIILLAAGYAPSNVKLTPAKFNTFLTTLDLLNDDVAAKYNAYDDAVEKRFALYEGKDGLRDRMQQTKEYIASEYGKKSNEYKDAVKIKY
jgi:hypothetical protein